MNLNRISRDAIALAATAACLGLLSNACSQRETPPPVVADPAARAPEASKTPGTAEPKATPEAEPAKAPAQGGTAEASACDEYVKTMCGKAGEESDVCGALKTVAVILPPKACVAALAEVDYAVGKLGDLRKVCAELADKLCADIGADTKTCAMVRERTPQFPTTQCQSMLTNYDAVIGELRALEARNKPLSAELVAKQQATDAASYGPEDAKVVVVEYSDFECPYCSMAAESLNALKKRYGNVVRFVFRQFPLDFHQNAMPAAQASLFAKEHGKFWELHDRMFANQKALSAADIEKYAAEVGLDVAQLKAALESKKYESQVQADMKLGAEVGVSGTPSMFLGAERIENAMDVAAISAKIDAALTAAGVPVPPAE